MHGFIVSLWNTAVEFLFSLIIFTVPQPFIITALWSHDCSPASSIKNPSEESSWNFPSTHGISASQFSLIFVTLRVQIPQAVFWKYLVSMKKKTVREFFASKLFLFNSFFWGRSELQQALWSFSWTVFGRPPPALNGNWRCGWEPVAGTPSARIKAASLQVHI